MGTSWINIASCPKNDGVCIGVAIPNMFIHPYSSLVNSYISISKIETSDLTQEDRDICRNEVCFIIRIYSSQLG